MKKQDQIESVTSLGQHLRKERELRGIELDEVSKVTRVRIAYLQHLEDDQLSELPADVYTRGYIRAYARFLGIDPERGIELYLQQAPVQSYAPAAAFEGSLGGSEAPSLPALSEVSGPAAASSGGMAMNGSSSGGRSRLGLVVVIALLVCAALLIAGVYYVNRSSERTADNKAKPSTTENHRFFVDG